MKITQRQLRILIKEEVSRINESRRGPMNPDWLAAQEEHRNKLFPDTPEEEYRLKQDRYADVFGDEEVPDDYEECGYCGFDHTYNPVEAREWHEENDPDGDLYK